MKTEQIESYVHHFVLEENSAWITAIRAVLEKEFRGGVYGGFGTGKSSPQLKKDLLEFLREQQLTQSQHLTYFAIFAEGAHSTFDWEDQTHRNDSEYGVHEFKSLLLRELSALSDSPFDENEGVIYIGERTLSVSGLHKCLDRSVFRFPYPSLIFNHPHQVRAYSEKVKFETISSKNLKQKISSSRRDGEIEL